MVSIIAKEDLKKAGLIKAVSEYGDTCNEFTQCLKNWTKHSSAAKLLLSARLSVGLQNKEKLRTFGAQVQSCEAAIRITVESTQLC